MIKFEKSESKVTVNADKAPDLGLVLVRLLNLMETTS